MMRLNMASQQLDEEKFVHFVLQHKTFPNTSCSY